MSTYNKIRELREDNDYTQNEIAKKMYMHRTQYRRYENGESEIPLNIAIMIAKIYNVSLDYIAGIKEEKEIRNSEIEELWKQLDEKEKDEIKNIIEYKIKNKKKHEEKKSVG